MSSPTRLVWADAAKGVAVVAVVFTHTVTKHLSDVDWDVSRQVLEGLTVLTRFGAPIRMPLFFLISGFFGARAILRGWRSLFSTKLALFYYLYVLWLIIQTALFQLTPDIETAVAHSPVSFVLQATIAPTNLWYLWALAAYFIVAKVGTRAPRVAIGAAAALALSPALPFLGGNFNLVKMHLVWFLVGCYGHDLVLAWSRRVTAWNVGGAFIVLTAAFAVQSALGARVGIVHLVASAAGAAFGVGVAVISARRLPAAATAVANHVGRNTLPIYVLQLPLIALWHLWSSPSGTPIGNVIDSSPVMTALYPFVLTAAVTALALGINRLLAPVLPFLFTKPHWLSLPTTLPGPVPAREKRLPGS